MDLTILPKFAELNIFNIFIKTNEICFDRRPLGNSPPILLLAPFVLAGAPPSVLRARFGTQRACLWRGAPCYTEKKAFSAFSVAVPVRGGGLLCLRHTGWDSLVVQKARASV